MLPFKSDAAAAERTRKFLQGVIAICLDYVERENRRSEKVIEFYQPDEIMRLFDFSIPDTPAELDRLVEDCRQTLAYQVRTGELSKQIGAPRAIQAGRWRGTKSGRFNPAAKSQPAIGASCCRARC